MSPYAEPAAKSNSYDEERHWLVDLRFVYVILIISQPLSNKFLVALSSRKEDIIHSVLTFSNQHKAFT